MKNIEYQKTIKIHIFKKFINSYRKTIYIKLILQVLIINLKWEIASSWIYALTSLKSVISMLIKQFAPHIKKFNLNF